MNKHLLGLVLILTVGCSVDSKISESTLDDFSLSKIVSHTEVPADGITPMLIRIQLQHSDGRFAEGFTPSLSILSGLGVINDGCGVSSKEGISECRLRSTIQGSKGVALNLTGHVPSSLAQETVNFLPIANNGGTITSIGGSNLLKQSASGYTVYSRVGFESGKLSQTASGYKIETTIIPPISGSN